MDNSGTECGLPPRLGKRSGPGGRFRADHPQIDDSKIVHFGYSLGGYLVARYAAHDHRSAAMVCNDGMTTFYASYPPIAKATLDLIEHHRDDEALPLLEALARNNTNVAGAFRMASGFTGLTPRPNMYARQPITPSAKR